MSGPGFPDSVLNLYILLNAWMFSTRNAPRTSGFFGFWSNNTGFERAVIFPHWGLEILAIYLFFSFKINRKKNPLIIPSENTAVSIWRLSSPSLFL